MVIVFGRPWQSQGLLYKHRSDSLISSVCDPLLKFVKYIYISKAKVIVNIKGNQNRIIGSNVMAILLQGLTFPIGEVAFGRISAHSTKEACFKA